MRFRCASASCFSICGIWPFFRPSDLPGPRGLPRRPLEGCGASLAARPFLSSGDSIWKSEGEQNFGKIGDPDTDKLIDQAAVETDHAARLELINQIDANLWELAGVVPLWQAYDFFVQNEDLANYGAWGFQSKDWTKIGYVTGSAKLEG